MDTAINAGSEEIHFATGECLLGNILVARSDRGVIAILLGDDPAALASDLENRFPQAKLRTGGAEAEALVLKVAAFVASPAMGLDEPLDLRGSAFELRVWEALQKMPAGSTASYTEVARRLGSPESAREVAEACAANALAVVIPCHRVVRKDGGLSGYRWGVKRKRALLQRERAQAALAPGLE